MEYSVLGNTGLAVSRLALGTATLTAGNQDIKALSKVGPDLADRLVGHALDSGVNFFDTADTYAAGESEMLLGRALADRRDRVVIATKAGFRSGPTITQSGLTRRHILWSVEQSLRRLKTDWIDVYLVHKEDPYTSLEETLTALDDVVRAGKVRYLGFSNWSPWKVSASLEIQRANGLAPFTHGQMHYSLLGRDVERDVIPMMRHYRIGLTVWGPLASGFLSGKYTPESMNDPDHRYAGFDILPFDKEHGFRVVEKVRSIAQRNQATVAQTALAWLLTRPAVTSILLGASTLDQLDHNLGAAKVTLSDEEIAELDAATRPGPVYPYWFGDAMRDEMTSTALRR